MDFDIIKEKEEAVAEAFRRGLLLTTKEKQIAKARAEALNAKAQMEAARAEAELARREAQELREHIISVSTKPIKIPFRTIIAVFTVVMMLAAIARLAYIGFNNPSAPTPTQSASQAPSQSHHQVLTHKPPSAGDVQFKLAMTRLQDDLSSFSGDAAETVQEVNQKHPIGPRPCPLEWVNGEAALSLDASNERIPPSLLMAVNRCADAIEKLQDEKAAALQVPEPK